MKKINWGFAILFVIVITQILFICLKVNDAVKWSWWWVMSPALISIATIVVCILIIAFAMKEADEPDGTELSDYYIERGK